MNRVILYEWLCLGYQFTLIAATLNEAMTEQLTHSPVEYCTEQVMRHDRERLMCAMLAPRSAREALVALLAWNLEIAHVGEAVSEEMVGLIRFQWWREALEEIYAGQEPRNHAVVKALAKAITAHNLPHELFSCILDAREADLQKAPFATLDALDEYALATGGALQELWLHALQTPMPVAREAVRHAGAAWALVGTLRAMHFQAHRGRVLLPGVEATEVLDKGFTPEVAQATQAVAELAAEQVRDARALRREIPKAALPALYPALLAEDFLIRLKRADYNPFDSCIEQGRAARAFKLWWASKRKRY